MAGEQQATPMGGCLVRVFWAFLGPALIGAAGLGLILNKSRIGSALDFLLVGGLIAAVVARLLDKQKPDPAGPSDGDIGRTSPSKYVVGVLIVGVLLFVLAHFVAPKL